MDFSTTSKSIAHWAGVGLKDPMLLTPRQIQAVCGSALAQADDTALPAAFDLPSCLLGMSLGAILTVATLLGAAYIFA